MLCFSSGTLAESSYDSTQPVIQTLTLADSLSQANSETSVRIYSGSTTGSINFPTGYSYAYVNGNRHSIGKGYTTYVQNGSCTLVITDTRATGCGSNPIRLVKMAK